MKKVLILGVASVQMDAIVMLKQLGYEVFACAMANDGPGAYVADNFDIINILDVPKIIEHIRKNNIDVIYSVGSDIAMPIASEISEYLSLPYFVSAQASRTCNQKGAMRETLGVSFEGNVPFQVIEDKEIIPEIPMPYIMKPSDAQGQRGIYLIRTLQEYKDNFSTARKYSRSGKVIIEKYIDGPELSVNAYMVEGQLCFMEVSDRVTWPQFTGLIHKHIVPTANINRGILHNLGNIVVNACNKIGILNGPVYLQIKVEDGTPYIIEITPRLDGCHMWKLLGYYTGVNILKLTFEHLINQDVSELNRYCLQRDSYELEFFCQQPNTIMEQDKFKVPKDSLTQFFYYKSGDMIRPVNGKYEKVGYFIRKIDNTY